MPTLYKRVILCVGSMSLCDSQSEFYLSAFIARKSLSETFLHHIGRRFGVNLRRLDFGMTEKLLNLFEWHSSFEQQSGDRVPEQVRMNFLFDTRLFCRLFNNLLNSSSGSFDN